MPRLTNKEFAVNFAQTYANSIFTDMLNVENQGSNFSWESFSENFKSLAASRLFMHMPANTDKMEELKEIVKVEFPKEIQRLMAEYQKEKPLPVKG